MITALSLTLDTLTVILDNGAQIVPVRSDNPKWKEILELVKQFDTTPEGKIVGPEDKLLALLSLKAIVETYSVGQLSVNSTGVTYRGQPLHTIDSARVMAFLRDGLPFKPIANYMARKMANPSARAIAELYSFLEHKNMPITPEGKIIAYKGVKEDFYSVHGNLQTVVLQGHVNESGQLLNGVGSVLEVERSSVDDNFKNHCSFGLHAGSLQYAIGWGHRVVLVEIDPADVVSVPDDCNCQKLRCCKYKVIGLYTGPMPQAYTDEFSSSTDPIDPDGEDDCPHCGSNSCDGNCNDEACDCGHSTCSECNALPNDTAIIVANAANAKSIMTEEIRAIFAEMMGIDPTSLDTSFLFPGTGMDELDEVEMAVALEDKYGTDLDDDKLEFIFKNEGINHLVEYIYTKVNPSAPITVETVESNPLDGKFIEGKQDGYGDRTALTPPQYLTGDEQGADSELHAAYIKGYVEGYTS
jgi:acyl carrier protein